MVLSDGGLAEAAEHGVGDLLDAALDAGADVVGLADAPALEHDVDGAAVVERRGSTPAGSRSTRTAAAAGRRSAWVVKSGITFSGNWYGP